MRTLLLMTALAGALMLSSPAAYAEEPAEKCPTGINCDSLPEGTFENWEKDKAFLDKTSLSTEQGCNNVFNVLWYWAKKGKLQARVDLLYTTTIPFGPDLRFPHSSQDYLNRKRFDYILAVHSVGSGLSESDNQYIDEYFDDLKMLRPKSEFGKCIQKNRTSECSKIAVEAEVVPSFETFAEEIDIFIKAGYKAQCPGAYSPHNP